MQYSNLDTIVRRWLLNKGKPIHYYVEGLFHAADCIRSLSTDTLKIINTARLPLNDYYAATLPDDFVDDIMVGIPAGNLLQPVPKADNLNPLRSRDSTGAFVPYGTLNSDEEGDLFYGFGGWQWFWNFNDYGEPTGRFFGIGGGAKANGYQIFKERREIQFTETFTSDFAVLQYISDGMHVDNASKVDVLAWDAIVAYIDWKSSINAAAKDSPEASTYYNEKRLLKGRLNDLTATDIKQIIRSRQMASPKN